MLDGFDNSVIKKDKRQFSLKSLPDIPKSGSKTNQTSVSQYLRKSKKIII